MCTHDKLEVWPSPANWCDPLISYMRDCVRSILEWDRLAPFISIVLIPIFIPIQILYLYHTHETLVYPFLKLEPWKEIWHTCSRSVFCCLAPHSWWMRCTLKAAGWKPSLTHVFFPPTHKYFDNIAYTFFPAVINKIVNKNTRTHTDTRWQCNPIKRILSPLI